MQNLPESQLHKGSKTEPSVANGKKTLRGGGVGGGHHTEKVHTGIGGHHTYFLNRGTNNLEYFYKFHLPCKFLTKLLQTCLGIYKEEVKLTDLND